MAYVGRPPSNATLSSADIADGIIVAADLAPDSVDSSELVDGSIDTAHIGDDQVTADKLANSINTDIATGVTANTTASAALPKAGGTMTGELHVSGAQVFIGHTDAGDSATVQIEQASTGESGIRIYKPSNDATNAQKFIEFLSNGTRANGRITGNGVGFAAFQEWSDERLKENIVTITGQLDLINQLRPVTFDWKVDGSSTVGFIAQEFQTVLPDNVSTDPQTQQQIDDDETGTMCITAWSSTEARLVGAIQELSTKNDALETENTALKTRMDALEARVLALEG